MSSISDLKILLVEDSAVMRKMERKVLQKLNVKTLVESDDGDTAMEKIKGEKDYDLVISDWNMPRMDGYQLLVWIRSTDEFKNLPFIMASGRGEKGEVNKALEAGVNGFIAKPFNEDELEDKINEAMGFKQKEPEKEPKQPVSRLTESGKVRLKVAHIQITDHLVLGVLKHLINSGELNPKYFELETECMSSWNPLAKSLEDGTVDAACILAPIAMDLFGYDVPIKLILFAHKNGSIFVRNKIGGVYKEPYQDFFSGKSFYIPHMLSIHNMLAHMFFSGIGLKYGVQGRSSVDVNFEVVPPIKMPGLLPENENAAGYLVAEPLGTKAIAAEDAELQFLSSELWEDHPCCVVTMQQSFIEQYSEAVQEFTEMLVYSGKMIDKKPDLAAEIAVSFLDPAKKLGLKVPILYNVLTEPKGIKTNNLFPVIEDLDRIQHYMRDKLGIGKIIDVDKFVDLQFAKKACPKSDQLAKSVFKPEKEEGIFQKLLYGVVDDKGSRAKALLSKEGKYLNFILDKQHYGINILTVKEIIPMRSIQQLPMTEAKYKGVIVLRDATIPVVDLRISLGMNSIEYDERSVIIILETEGRDITPYIGVIVDSVSEVKQIEAKDIEKPTSTGVSTLQDYIIGMAKQGDEVETLLNIELLLQNKSGELLHSVA